MKRFYALCLGAIIISTIFLSSCTQKELADIPEIISDTESLSVTIEGQTWDNLFSYTVSPNQRYILYVASALNEEPEAFLHDRTSNTCQQLTNNGYYMESDIHVDDHGNWALALTEASVSTSKLIYNGEAVTDGSAWDHSICFVGDTVFYASYDSTTKTTTLNLYDPAYGETTVICTDLPITTGKSTALNADTVLLETYNLQTHCSTVMAVYPRAKEGERLQAMTDGTGSSILNTNGDAVTIEQISGDANALYLFNAYYWLWRYQTLEPWSGSTDSSGRISWNVSERLFGELELLKKTGDEELKTHIGTMVHRLLMTRKAAYEKSGREEDQFLFPTLKYSLD